MSSVEANTLLPTIAPPLLPPLKKTANNEHWFKSAIISRTIILCRSYIPYGLLTISIFQLIMYLTITKDINKFLRFDPNNLKQAWRFVTYMFAHDDTIHISLNITTQCLFASILEKHQGILKVITVYFAGGITGVLGASCVRPDFVIGASAGIYALLISHMSHVVLNFRSIKYKICWLLTIAIIVISDITSYLLHTPVKTEPVISEGAHLVGAISGFFVGLLLYKTADKDSKIRKRVIFWISWLFYTALILTLVILKLQINRCTPENSLKIRYNFSC